MKKQLCFIGAGKHASANVYPSAVLAGAEICAVATRDAGRSQAALRRFGSTGRAYADYREMLSSEACPNVVVVTGVNDAPKIVEDCLAAGKNVFSEKPLGLSLESASRIARAAEMSKSCAMVGFMKRYAPVYLRLKRLIERGELGAVKSFCARFYVDATGWNSTESGFVFGAAIHYVDLIRSLFGEVSRVSGFHSVDGGLISQALSVRCDGGAVGIVGFESRPAWRTEPEALCVTFERGFAETENLSSLRVHRADGVPVGEELSPLYFGISPDALPWRDLSECDEVYLPSETPASGTERDLCLRGFVGEMNHFLDCCYGGGAPYSSAGDNVKTTALCEKILASLA